MINLVLGGRYIGPLARGFSRLSYVLRDVFATADANPLTTPRTAEPGPGTWTVTDVEGVLKILGGRLRGGTQPTSPVWGDSRLVGDGVARAAGRVLAARITLQDAASDMAFGFATGTGIADPRTDGHGWLMENSGGLYAIIPGVKTSVSGQPRNIKPMQYLAVVALDTAGAAILLSTVGASIGTPMIDPLGIPAYPSARVVWVDGTGTDATLYPYVSFLDDVDNYPNGHAVEDVRIVDVTAWSGGYGLATVHDEFTRADSATTLGGSWAADAGTWGISGNKAYVASGSGFIRAYYANSLPSGDGIVVCDVTAPTAGTNMFGLVLRRQDASNFIRLWNNSTTNSVYLQTWVAGGFGATIYSMAQTWTAGQTYRVVVAMVGNRYSVWIDGVQKMAWVADSNSRFLTATGNGFYAGNTPTGATWDNFATYPLTVTLPAEIRDGAAPIIPNVGATIASDTFTDSDSTALDAHTAESGGAWTEHTGTWTIASSKAAWATGGTTAIATQDIEAEDVECSVDVTIPASLPDGYVRAGIVGRYTDASNYIYARLFVDDVGQAGEDEIELIEMVAGTESIVHKVSLANFYATSTTYTLKLQFIDDLVHVFLDGQPLISYYTRAPATGTRFGLRTDSIDDGCVFDNWTVKELS